MQTVPPVLVDIILDPYVLNVLPRSLVPTAAYILVVAVASWFLSKGAWYIVAHLVVSSSESAESSCYGSELSEKKTL